VKCRPPVEELGGRPPAEELGAVALLDLRNQMNLLHRRGFGDFERWVDESTLIFLSKKFAGNRRCGTYCPVVRHGCGENWEQVRGTLESQGSVVVDD